MILDSIAPLKTKVGFATLETMASDMPGTDLTYLLPEAQSAVSFYVPFDKELTMKYLGKTDPSIRGIHEEHNLELHRVIWRACQRVKHWLIEQGYKAISVIPNNHYRTDVPNWQITLPPELSLRYLAVASGVASFGWSGNVGTKEHGTAILVAGLITSAKLEPTKRITESEGFCNKCKICTKVCAFGMFNDDEETTVVIGGETFSYSKRGSIQRCFITCGGGNGLHRSGKFSTWSPGRYEYAETESEVRRACQVAITSQKKRLPFQDGSQGYQPASFDGKYNQQLSCGNCNYICGGSAKETALRYKTLVNSGCVVQREDGCLEIYPPEKAKEVFESMPAKHQRLYTRDYKKRMQKQAEREKTSA